MTGKGLAFVFVEIGIIADLSDTVKGQSGPFGDSTDRSPASTAALPVSARSVLENEF